MQRRGELFARDAPVYVARRPGRLDLMGGNDDYTGGMVFEATIREATWAAAQRRADRNDRARQSANGASTAGSDGSSSTSTT